MYSVTVGRPSTDEHIPYYSNYIDLVPEGDILSLLESQMKVTQRFLENISEERAISRYAEGKWTIKQVIGHLIDAERIMAYRALRFARGDGTPLPGFEPEDLMKNVNFNARELSDLADEFKLVRLGNIKMLSGLSEESWHRRGTASDNEVSVRALAYIIAGHELHHR